ncbi:MAG: HEAT repeat domain-containing protein [Sandaracinaceae bacterium]
MRSTTARVATIGAFLGVVLLGCHAAPDDVEGQARELMDSTRRENALQNLNRLYDAARRADRDQEHGENVEAFADAAVPAVTEAYLNTTSDRRNQYRMLELLGRIGDPRAMPAFLAALDYQPEVTENHAVLVGQTFRRMEIPEDQMGPAIEAMSEALRRIQGDRQEHNTLRLELIQTLGHLGDPRATPVLVETALRMSEDQDIIINRLAIQQIAKIRDPEAVGPMIEALFIFQIKDNNLEKADVQAEQALVQIGWPSIQPLLDTLHGENEAANRRVDQLLAVVQEHDPAAREFDRSALLSDAVTRALGFVGHPVAFPVIMERISPLTDIRLDRDGQPTGEVAYSVATIAQNSAMALSQLSVAGELRQRARDALIGVYRRVPKGTRTDLIRVILESRDEGYFDFYVEEVEKEEDEMPQLRLISFRGATMVADAEQMQTVRRLYEAEPGPAEGGYKQNLAELEPVFEVTEECDRDLECWLGKFDDDNPLIVQKATYMAVRLGRGNDAVVDPLVDLIRHGNFDVRLSALRALERASPNGSEHAVRAIDELANEEAGTRSWERFATSARITQGRLRTWAHSGDGIQVATSEG